MRHVPWKLRAILPSDIEAEGCVSDAVALLVPRMLASLCPCIMYKQLCLGGQLLLTVMEAYVASQHYYCCYPSIKAVRSGGCPALKVKSSVGKLLVVRLILHTMTGLSNKQRCALRPTAMGIAIGIATGEHMLQSLSSQRKHAESIHPASGYSPADDFWVAPVVVF